MIGGGQNQAGGPYSYGAYIFMERNHQILYFINSKQLFFHILKFLKWEQFTTNSVLDLIKRD